VHLTQVDMTAKTLAAAIDKAGEMAPPAPDQIPNLNGAFETARILKEFMAGTQGQEGQLVQSPA